MSVQITDCTIRDGGYLFNKNPDNLDKFFASMDAEEGISSGMVTCECKHV